MIEQNQNVSSLDAKISTSEDSSNIIDLIEGEDEGQLANECQGPWNRARKALK